MARKELRALNGDRRRFRGTFVREGTKPGWRGMEPTVLLTHITDCETGISVCDHLWFNRTKAFERAALRCGDVIEFDARVDSYQKGYKGRRLDVYKPIETDYHLTRPTKVAVVAKASEGGTGQ